MTSEPPGTLYHYTCDHHVRRVTADGVLRNSVELAAAQGVDLAARMAPNPVWSAGLVWMTDLEIPPSLAALGFEGRRATCDRTAWRFTIADTMGVVPWTRWVHGRRDITAETREEFEAGCMPRHWWVAAGPVPVLAPPVNMRGTGVSA